MTRPSRHLERPDSPVDPTIRLRLATRIHFALLRHYGEDVGVSDLLKGDAGAREALWVCEASGVDEFVTLARQFQDATRDAAKAKTLRSLGPAAVAAPAAVPQDLGWAQDTSGFGLSTPPSFLEPAATPSIGSWLNPSNWLRR